MIQEVWKPVVGYEGYYQVSNLGNVIGRSYPKHLSLDQLRRIDAIINENNESKE